MSRYISIDEEGYFHSGGIRLEDPELCSDLLQKLSRNQWKSYVTEMSGHSVFVEAFDHPLLIHQLDLKNQILMGRYQLNHQLPQLNAETLQLDEWDRITGLTTLGHRFVLNRSAQMQFFDQVESFDDDGYVWKGQHLPFGRWPMAKSKDLSAEFWGEGYRAEPPWDLGGPHPALAGSLAQLKLTKSRILVLGCGRGHDAAYMAKQGHLVTAVDFSADAIQQATALYGTVQNLKFEKMDALNLPQSFHGNFDIVFEHTLYCAIAPEKRNALVRSWRQVLHDQGHLLAILPLFDREDGPPYASTEWELRERLKKNWHFLYWTRTRQTDAKRQGQELLIYARP